MQGKTCQSKFAALPVLVSRAVYDDKKSSKLLVPDALIVEPQLINYAASASASVPGSCDMTDLKARWAEKGTQKINR